jgi:2-phosphosulfolactate phosphatase
MISELRGSLSPEARAAQAAFLEAGSEIPALIRQCVSGKQLIDGRLESSLALATELDVSACVPKLVDGAYHRADN